MPYLRSSDVSESGIHPTLFISELDFRLYEGKTGSPKKGDVLFVSGGNVGFSLVKDDNDPVYVQGGAILYARTSESRTLSGKFLKTHFESPSMRMYIDTASTGLTLRHFTLKPAKNAPVIFPKIEEQNRVSCLFEKIVNLITVNQRKHKKASKCRFLEKTTLFPTILVMLFIGLYVPKFYSIEIFFEFSDRLTLSITKDGMRRKEMKLFKRHQQTLESINPVRFDKEKQLQSLIENNLDELFGLEFITTELPVSNYRLDTLAFDPESKSFVVLEYKRDHNSSVVDQGTAYLTTLLKNKAELTLAYNEKFDARLTKADFEWDQLRVMFVAARYEKYQQIAAQFPNLPIELWEVHQYEGGFLSVERLDDPEEKLTQHKNHTSRAAQKKKPEQVEGVEDLQLITENTHLEGVKEEISEMYVHFKSDILAWDPEIEVSAKKKYMSFKLAKRSVVDFVPMSSQLKIIVNMQWGKLSEPRNLAKNMTSTGHWGNGDYEFNLSNDTNYEYVLSLIKESWLDKRELISRK